MKNKINKNRTTVIAENKQDDKVIDKNIDFDAAEDTETELEDNTVIDMEEGNNKSEKITTEISECQEDDEVLDNLDVRSTGNTEFNNAESVERKMTELPVGNVNK